MRIKDLLLYTCVGATCFGFSAPTYAQLETHSDVLFEYVDNKIAHYTEVPGTNNVAGGTFINIGSPILDRYATSPGFASEDLVGLNVNPNDTIYYNVHSDLLYWDGSMFTAPVAGTQITVDHRGSAPNTIITTSSGEQLGDPVANINFIDTADGGGNVHAHFNSWYLDDGSGGAPSFGAYGYLMSLGTDEVGIADSDPFYLVFNYGMTPTAFETALVEFESLLVPSVLEGDFNDDGQVDAADYTVWRDNLGDADETDINNAGDGLNGVDSADHALWASSFGNTASSSASAVPEPSSLLLVTASLMTICGVRRN